MNENSYFYRIGFPLYQHQRDWAFVLVRAGKDTYSKLRWYKDKDNKDLVGDTRFIIETGASNALLAKPKYYDFSSYDFLEVANEEGKLLDWHQTSDTAACMLALAQSEHNRSSEASKYDQIPIVLISCSAGPLPPAGGYHNAEIRTVSGEYNKESNATALKKKWRAAVDGHSRGLRILALVLPKSDAEILERELGLKAKELTADTFRDLAASKTEQPTLVRVESEQLPLLARALGIPERDFIAKPSETQTTSSFQNLKRRKLRFAMSTIAIITVAVFILLSNKIYTKDKITSPEPNPLATNMVVLFHLYPASQKLLDSEPTAIIHEKLDSYLKEQSKDIPCNQNIEIANIDEVVTNESEALQHAQKYGGHLVIWGDYLATGHQVSLRTHVWDATLKKSWVSEPVAPIALESLLSGPVESLIGRKIVALFHLELGFIALKYDQKSEAIRHFKQYEAFDKQFIDKQSMYAQASPDKDLRLAITTVYRWAGHPEATQLISDGYDTCAPDDKDCKAQYDSQQGCVLVTKGEMIAGQQLFSTAQNEFSEAGNTVAAVTLTCNMAEALENSKSNQEAFLKWESCEQGLRPFVDVEPDAFSLHRKAILAMGRILHHSCDAAAKERSRGYLESIKPQPQADKDQTYADARYLLAHMDTRPGHIKERIKNIRTALQYLPDDARKEKRAGFLSLKGELDYRNGDYFTAAHTKSEAAQIYMSIGYNPVTLHNCHENEARCDFLVFLDSHYYTKSADDFKTAEAMTFHYSPCNGILTCMSQPLIKQKLLSCGYQNGNQYTGMPNLPEESFTEELLTYN